MNELSLADRARIAIEAIAAEPDGAERLRRLAEQFSDRLRTHIDEEN